MSSIRHLKVKRKYYKMSSSDYQFVVQNIDLGNDYGVDISSFDSYSNMLGLLRRYNILDINDEKTGNSKVIVFLATLPVDTRYQLYNFYDVVKQAINNYLEKHIPRYQFGKLRSYSAAMAAEWPESLADVLDPNISQDIADWNTSTPLPSIADGSSLEDRIADHLNRHPTTSTISARKRVRTDYD